MSVSQASANPHRSETTGPVARAVLAQLTMLAGFLESLPTKFGALLDDALSVAHGDATVVEHATTTEAHVTGQIMMIGRALLIAVIVLIVLGELYATDIVANPDNPNTFTNLTGTFASYGETAYIMVGLGLIALGASVALSYFGGFTNNGGR